MSTFEIKNGQFWYDGEPFRIMSGAIHYFRTLPEYWSDRLDKLVACGLNTVETYVAWNMHEPHEGEFCFDGLCDMEGFIRLAGEKGLKVIVRPTPYICAEWEMGGLPAWLLKNPEVELRATNDFYFEKINNYYKELIPRIAKLQCTNGGPVIMVQIENEYGSYGNDANYLRFLKDTMEQYGIHVPMFTSDGEVNYFLCSGTLPDVYKTVNFFSTDIKKGLTAIRELQPDMPVMIAEFWCGWFDHWTEEHHGRSNEEYRAAMEGIMQENISFNIYMFHGGTNFGFMNGANHTDAAYQPDVSSYDYDALLSENGDLTEKYFITKELIEKYTGVKAPEKTFQPAESKAYGKVQLTQYADIFKQIPEMCTVHHTVPVKTMEYFGQNYGYILYHTTLPRYNMEDFRIYGAHDLAYLFVNGEYQGRIYRNDTVKHIRCNFDREVNTVDVLVENFGRTNYGRFLHDRKGVAENMCIGNKLIFGWDVYCFELDNIEKAVYTDVLPETGSSIHGLLKGTFTVDTPADTYLNTDSLSVGQAYCNGFNLGRFWTEAGPQMNLYIPAALLHPGENEIVIFENEKAEAYEVELSDKPRLSK